MKPIDTTSLFAPLHQHLIDLLRSLTPDDWQRDTICTGWTVKDVAAHLLDTSLRTIALYRDHYTDPEPVARHTYRDLVTYLNQLNNDWVRATRRLSPALLVDWLEQTGPTAEALLVALPPNEPARFSVAWAGQTESPNWFHVAREYTERWHHQQQIRLAVNQQEGILTDTLYFPLLDTFMRALPHAYAGVEATPGTLLHVTIPDLPGGNWWVRRQTDGWQFVPNQRQQATATIVLDRPRAWQLFTSNLPTDVAATYIHVDGDQALGHHLLTMRSVMM